MKIQNLAVIFIVIILPISLVISTYTKYQIKTVNTQSEYDAKLLNATYDAVKSYQLNSASSTTSDIANSKMRDIEASANTFFNSISSNFNMAGYNKDVLKEYVPALVYTMYDGMYLYSSYTNRLNGSGKKAANDPMDQLKISDATKRGEIVVDKNDRTYYNDQDMYGLRPYVFYSRRYKKEAPSKTDVTITYSLDNYISIQGTDFYGDPVNIQGYVLSEVEYSGEDLEGYPQLSYRGVDIPVEKDIKQSFYNNGTEPGNNTIGLEEGVFCRKIDGVKYYNRDNGKNNFSYLNNSYLEQNNGLDVIKNDNALKYYTEGLILQKLINGDPIPSGIGDSNAEYPDLSDLSDLSEKDEVDNTGQRKGTGSGEPIFKGIGAQLNSETSIEEPNSNFNQHRLKVIRETVEYNLSTALANYNNTLGSYEFRMPKLKEEDWDKILNNIAVITFLQGVNIGGKVYNGYAVVPNNENEDVVADTSIYIIGTDGKYHTITDEKLLDTSTNPVNINNSTAVGVFNADLEIHSITTDENGDTSAYYIPKGNKDHEGDSVIGAWEYGDYGSIITSSDLSEKSNDQTNVYMNMYDYVDNSPFTNRDLIKTIYYTALARERYGTYKGARFTVDFGEQSVEVKDENDNLVARIEKDYFEWPLANKPPIGRDPNTNTDYHQGAERTFFEFTGLDDFGARDGAEAGGSYDHDGIDIRTYPNKGPIYAAAAGNVTVGNTSGWGNYVQIDHDNGISTFYAHLDSVNVTSGHVEKGEQIGIEGNTGQASGYCLHFRAFKTNGGNRINPLELFKGIYDYNVPNGSMHGSDYGYIRPK